MQDPANELRRAPSWRSSQNAPWTNFSLCEVALLGHRLRSARHGSRARAFCQLRRVVDDVRHEGLSTKGYWVGRGLRSASRDSGPASSWLPARV